MLYFINNKYKTDFSILYTIILNSGFNIIIIKVDYYNNCKNDKLT